MVDNEFEVEVGGAALPGEYAVRVVHAPAGGEPAGTLRLPLDDLLNRRRWLEDAVLASAARARGGIVSEAEQPLRQTGQELFEALFAGVVAEAYRASLAVARDRGKKLRVVLRLPPELSVLPWEALFDPEIGAYLCRKEPLVRHVPAPFPLDPLPVRPPLRILGLIASPRGLPALDVEAEQQQLTAALAGPAAAGQVWLEWLPQASWETVHDRLLTGQWQVLHFIGHGDYDPDTDEGRVALVGADGRAEWVEATQLADLLDQADPKPRLVVLNSCSSGQGGATDLFSGTAATLVRSGISAVAAMQFRISDRAAVAFPRGFYTALAVGRGVDEAVGSGRIAILGVRHTLEWVTPVLYLRGNATRLFTLTTTPAAAPPLMPPATAWPAQPEYGRDLETIAEPVWPGQAIDDQHYAEALAAFFAGRWEEAVDRFEALQARYPGDVRVQSRLDTARGACDLANWSAEADAAAERADWAQAIVALERIIAVDGTYQEARSRLEHARTAHRRQSLLDEITALHRARRWQAVIAAGNELHRVDPDQPDPNGMLADARQQLVDEDIAERYAAGLRQLDMGDRSAAIEVFIAIQHDRPGYRDTPVLFTLAQQQEEKQQQQSRIANLQAELRRLAEAQDWPAVLAISEQLAALDAAVADPDGLTTQARQRAQQCKAHLASTGSTQAAIPAPDTALRQSSRPPSDTVTTQIPTARGVPRLAHTLTGHTGRVSGVAFSPDGRLLASCSKDKTVRLWDPATGTHQRTLTGHTYQVFGVAFSPDGRLLASCSKDKTVRLWDPATGTHQRTLTGHTNWVFGVAFSPDGRLLASCSDDKTVRLWDPATGTHQRTLTGHTGRVSGVAFSPDGRLLASCSDDKTVRLWDLTPAAR